MKNFIIKTAIAGAMVVATALPAFAQSEVVLTMWHSHPEWKDRVQAILDIFEAKHPKIKIQLEEISGTNYSTAPQYGACGW